MPSEPLTLAVINLLATYLLHSTLLLGFVAIAFWLRRPRSRALVERAWKAAAVLPLMTTLLPWATGLADPIYVCAFERDSVGVVDLKGQADVDASHNSDLVVPAEFDELAHSPPIEGKLDALLTGSEASIDARDLEGKHVLAVDPTAATPPMPLQSESAASPAGVLAALPIINDDAAGPSAYLPPSEPEFDHTSSVLPSDHALARGARLTAALVVFIVLMGLVRCVFLSWQIRLKLRAGRPLAQGPVRDALTWVTGERWVGRPVRLLETDSFSEPVALGLIQWTIIVPPGIAERLSSAELRALLAHELAHLVRGDAWWLLFGRLLCAVLPFQPLNFLSRKAWKQAAEFQCDDWAARRTNDPLALARCLARLAEWHLGARQSSHASAARGTVSTLSKRVECLLADRREVDPWSRVWRRRMLWLVIAVVAVVVSWRGPQADLWALSATAAHEISHLPAAGDDDFAAASPQHTIDDASLAARFQSLDSDLRQLLDELETARNLLGEMELDQQAGKVVQRLERRCHSMRQRRDALAALLQFGDVAETDSIGPSQQTATDSSQNSHRETIPTQKD